MKIRHSLILLLLLVGTAAAAGAFQPAPAMPASNAAVCHLETAVGLPSWITTGVWTDKLLVVDVIERKLVEISQQGVADKVRSAIGEYLADSSITRIRPGVADSRGQAQPLVEFAGGKLLNLDRSLAPGRKAEALATNLQSGDRKLINLIDWVLSGDGKDVIGYADLEGPQEGRYRWMNAFVRFSLDKPDSFRIIHERPFPDGARMAMHLTYPLMASIGSNAYVALVDGPMRLWRFGPDDKELQPLSLRAFPAHLRGRIAPMLPSMMVWDDFPGIMETVAQSEMPAGLFAWDNALFLLSRRLEKNERQWFLSKIDPVKEELLWTVRVPGSADHLTVIPGPVEWAFLEKGPVAAHLNQTTHHIRFVSSTQMRLSSLKSLCN
jgi:hypothetical protein